MLARKYRSLEASLGVNSVLLAAVALPRNLLLISWWRVWCRSTLSFAFLLSTLLLPPSLIAFEPLLVWFCPVIELYSLLIGALSKYLVLRTPKVSYCAANLDFLKCGLAEFFEVLIEWKNRPCVIEMLLFLLNSDF